MKSQADIITAILIVLISIGLVATAYTYGLPLIQKYQDQALAERVNSGFDQDNVNSLPNKIEDVANNRGEATFTVGVDGLWQLNEAENSLSFTFLSRAVPSGIAADQPVKPWFSKTAGVDCNLPIENGIVGEKASVVCARADTSDSRYNVSYKIYFRQIDEPTGLKAHKIELVKHESGVLRSTTGKIRISFSRSEERQVGAQTLIISKIKILL